MKKIKLLSKFIYLILALLVVIYIAPLVWLVFSSLKTNPEIQINPFGLPEVAQFINYSFAWTVGKLGSATLNSVIVCGITLVLSIIMGAMAAFAIGRMTWKLSSLAMTYFLIGMMIPIHAVLIPLFVTFAKINLTDSLISLIIPYIAFSLPLTIFILTNFFKSLPKDMFEAACIDGCSIYRLFFSIALPLAKTGILVTALMTFISNWNELLVAMVFISDVRKKTLPVTLLSFVGPYATNYTQMFAAIVIAIVPSIVVYCLFSNQIVEGLTAGAVKG